MRSSEYRGQKRNTMIERAGIGMGLMVEWQNEEYVSGDRGKVIVEEYKSKRASN